MCRPKKTYDIVKEQSSERSSGKNKMVIPTTNGDENVDILSYKKFPEHALPSNSGSWKDRMTQILSDTDSDESGKYTVVFCPVVNLL